MIRPGISNPAIKHFPRRIPEQNNPLIADLKTGSTRSDPPVEQIGYMKVDRVRFVTNHEVNRLFASCDTASRRGRRDLALLNLFLYVGPEVGRLVTLTLNCFVSNPAQQWIDVLIHGAGRADPQCLVSSSRPGRSGSIHWRIFHGIKEQRPARWKTGWPEVSCYPARERKDHYE